MRKITILETTGYGYRPSIEQYDAATDEWVRIYTGEYWPDIPTAANMAAAHMIVSTPPPGPALFEGLS